jgi:hypothetical protein
MIVDSASYLHRVESFAQELDLPVLGNQAAEEELGNRTSSL